MTAVPGRPASAAAAGGERDWLRSRQLSLPDPVLPRGMAAAADASAAQARSLPDAAAAGHCCCRHLAGMLEDAGAMSPGSAGARRAALRGAAGGAAWGAGAAAGAVAGFILMLGLLRLILQVLAGSASVPGH